MTCCQVSKHGFSGDETAANRNQTGDFVCALIYFHQLETANIFDWALLITSKLEKKKKT